MRQDDGWVAIPRDQIAALKFRNISHLAIRLFDGKRVVLNLYRFPARQVDRIHNALTESQRANAADRAK